MFRISFFALLTAFLVLVSCSPSPTMDEEEFTQITDEFTEEAAHYAYVNQDVEFDADFEMHAQDMLDEVAQRYGYTADDYLEQAEELGYNWNSIFQQVEIRFDQLHMQELDEYERDLDVDHEMETDPTLPVDPGFQE